MIERRLVKVLGEDGQYEEPPDLLIIDGGKGQLGMAVEVMRELNLTGIDLVSLAKGRSVDEEERAEIEARARAKVKRQLDEKYAGTDAIPDEREQLDELAKRHDPALGDAREIAKMFERIYTPGRMNPIVLAPDSAVTHLLQRIRDEAHRFAVEFQRKQRSTHR